MRASEISVAHPVPGTPRWSALLFLALCVLGAHLLLLAGGVPGWSLDSMQSDPQRGSAPVVSMQVRSIAPAVEPALSKDSQNTGNTARWVDPVTPKPIAATPPIAEKPAPPPEEPAVAAAAPVPEPIPEVAPAPIETTTTVAAATPEASPDSTVPTPASRDLPAAFPAGNVRLLFDATIRIKVASFSADARMEWQQNGAQYSAKMELSSRLLGTRLQTSSGHMDAAGLAPERFSDKRRGSEKATHFDYAEQRIRYSSNAPDSPLRPGAQDRLSMFLQLGGLMRAQPTAFEPGQALRMPVASTGDAEVWQFQIGPEETLALPAGSVGARKLTRAPRREFDSTVEIWLAPSLQYLPVRIRITEHNGDQAEQQLREIPVLTPSPSPIQ